MRIGVTGGRRYADADRVRQVRESVERLTEGRSEPLTLVHGAASGLDLLWAKAVRDSPRWLLEPHEAAWGRECDELCRHGGWRPHRGDGSTYCPAAGPIRNARMVASGLDLLLAFSGGKGTEDMTRRARAAGVLTLRVEE